MSLSETEENVYQALELSDSTFAKTPEASIL